MVAQSHGLLISVSLASSPDAAVYLVPVSFIPLFLLCGFFVRYDDLSDFFKGISYLSYMKFSMEAIIITIYGYDRCGNNVTGVYNQLQASLQSWISGILLEPSSEVDQAPEKQELVENFTSGVRITYLVITDHRKVKFGLLS